MTNKEYQEIKNTTEVCWNTINNAFQKMREEIDNSRTVEDVVNEANSQVVHND